MNSENPFEQTRRGLAQAKAQIRAVDLIAEDLAVLLKGRCRQASKTWIGGDAIADLKRELKDFNIHTRRWKK